MSSREEPQDEFRRIIESNTWDATPHDHEDHEPWAEEIAWQPQAQRVHEIPLELLEDQDDQPYDPDPGEITRGVSPEMLRALGVILASVVITVGLAFLPGSLPMLIRLAGLAGVIGGLYLAFRALPENPRDDDGAVV